MIFTPPIPRLAPSPLKNDANRYYDVIGVSYSQDLDIYGNTIRNATDDVIEADNAAINVRIWGNYLDYALDMISLQLMQAGPVYVFRNVFDWAADIKDGNPGSYNVGVPGSTYGSASPMKLSQNNGGSVDCIPRACLSLPQHYPARG